MNVEDELWDILQQEIARELLKENIKDITEEQITKVISNEKTKENAFNAVPLHFILNVMKKDDPL